MAVELKEAGTQEEKETMEKESGEAAGAMDGLEDAGTGRKKQRRRLSGSRAVKTAVFLIMTISWMIGMTAVLVSAYMEKWGYYNLGLKDVLALELRGEVYLFTQEIEDRLEAGDLEGAERICGNKNVDVELVFYDSGNRAKVLWATGEDHGDDHGNDMATEIKCGFTGFYNGITFKDPTLNLKTDYWFRIYFDTDFPHGDQFQNMGRLVTFGYENRYVMLYAAAGCGGLCIICILFLLCGAGHQNGKRGIVPGVLTGLYLDVMTALYGGGMWFLLKLAFELAEKGRKHWLPMALLAGVGTAMMALTILYLMDFALRAKMGKFWKNSLLFVALQGLVKIARWSGRKVLALLKGVPAILSTVLIFGGICVVECIVVLVFMRGPGALVLWALEKTILFLVVVYVALICRKLLNASRALAQGQENYKVDTSNMFGEFKEHGENLNSVSEGISAAVAARMKSEHLKTELITNVSHDIKTPLTSIINYADLIWEEAGEAGSGPEEESPAGEAKIKEYAEVLVRQSKRLKKLLEDLVEASKATTGNLEVNLEPCEAGVLLSQAVGEYQQRMEEKGLQLIARQPEQSVTVMADGRHLWRVFDNLLNNICKYAQENSRVYLSVEEKEGVVQIIFRNMSKYPLDISGEELEERFVRGDRSRHMEGNGLGLSIAKSLIGLQSGKMDIVIDGDLFKVVLSFQSIPKQACSNENDML